MIDEVRKRIEQDAIARHRRHVGKLIEVAYLCGYDNRDDSCDIACNPPAIVEVQPMRPEDGVIHWNDEWLDPYWDARLIYGPAQAWKLRSHWIDGPSVNAKTGEVEWPNVRVLGPLESLMQRAKVALNGGVA